MKNICRDDESVKLQMIRNRVLSLKENPVHEYNHTRILVPEVLCSLVGPETQNVPTDPIYFLIGRVFFSIVPFSSTFSFFISVQTNTPLSRGNTISIASIV